MTALAFASWRIRQSDAKSFIIMLSHAFSFLSVSTRNGFTHLRHSKMPEGVVKLLNYVCAYTGLQRDRLPHTQSTLILLSVTVPINY